jgi:hypothetical protein
MKHYLSGHMYRGSAIETDSSCGNCDGGKCEGCVPVWEVADTSYYTIEEAQVAEASLSNILIRPVDSRITDELWASETRHISDDLYKARFNEQSELVIDITFTPYPLPYFEVVALVNPEHPKFMEMYEQATENLNRYLCCTCSNKDEEWDGCCRITGCLDSRCFYEMEHCCRIEKKWYM